MKKFFIDELNSQNRQVSFASNSVLGYYLKDLSGVLGYGKEELISRLTMQTKNTLELYKKHIFSLSGVYKDAVESSLVKAGSSGEVTDFVSIEEIDFDERMSDYLNICSKYIPSERIATDYIASFKEGLYVIADNLETYNVTELKRLFLGIDEELDNYTNMAMGKFSNLELKEIITKYCLTQYGSSSLSSRYNGLISAPHKTIINKDIVILVTSFFINLFVNNTLPTNRKPNELEVILKSIIKELLGSIKKAIETYEHLERADVLCYHTEAAKEKIIVGNGEETQKIFYVIKPTYDKYLDMTKDNPDAVDALCGAYIVEQAKNNYIYLRDVISRTQQLAESYDRYIRSKSMVVKVKRLNLIRECYLEALQNILNGGLDGELKDILLNIHRVSDIDSIILMLPQSLNKVLESKNDNEILNIKDMSYDIISMVLFKDRYFRKFVNYMDVCCNEKENIPLSEACYYACLNILIDRILSEVTVSG